MSRLGDFGARLYHGDASFDFVGRRRTWYLLSVVILVLSAGGLLVRGLELGVEFKGGAVFEARAAGAEVARVREAVISVGVEDPIVQQVGTETIRVETGQVSTEKSQQVQGAMAKALGIDPEEIKAQIVGPSWGADVTRKALFSLAVFLALVIAYLSFAFEWKMAVAAIVALLHDLLITIGVYAIVGFQVTPATVIGLLTILGYSLYDTVVVFDKVKENTAGLAGGSRMAYGEAANLAVNQTIVRSINTSLVALLPVAGLLFIGAGVLGTGTLKDLALALFVGIAAGTYSSIFIATPIAVQLKEREPQMQALAKRVAARQAAPRAPKSTVGVAARGGGTGVTGAGVTGADGAGAGRDRVVESGGARLNDADDADNAGDAATEQPPQPPRKVPAGQGSRQQPRQQPRKSTSRSKRRPTGKKRR
jgi:preprotein translocase subunit SecF